MQNEVIQKYISSFALLEEHLNGQKDSAVHGLRKSAFSSFSDLGFPGRRDENWKYTDVSAFSKQELEAFIDPKWKSDASQLNLFEQIDANRLVFIDGIFSEVHSQVIERGDGIVIGSLKSLLSEHSQLIRSHMGKFLSIEEENFSALNTAFMQDGAFIHIAKNRALAHPVILIYASSAHDAVVSNPRSLIIAEENSELQLIEDFQALLKGHSSYVNLVTELSLARNSRISHTIVQDLHENHHQIGTYKISQAKDSRYRSYTISLEGGLLRNDVEVVFTEDHAEADLKGIYTSNGRNLIDNHLLVRHNQPNCLSNQLYKGILDGDGKAVFNGKVYVAEDAQKTNAYQSNKNLLLSKSATINTKPELEIFADDVKCSHGATTGQLNKDELFYLKARGIPEQQAKSILMYAFVNEVVDEIPNETLRKLIDQRVRKRLKLETND